MEEVHNTTTFTISDDSSDLSLMQEPCHGHNLWPVNDDDTVITVCDDSNGAVAQGNTTSERFNIYYKSSDGTMKHTTRVFLKEIFTVKICLQRKIPI